MKNLNDSLDDHIEQHCKHPQAWMPDTRTVCKTCAIAWSQSRVDAEIERLFEDVQKETGHLTVASLITAFKDETIDS